jgi:hypothetical protein
MNRDPKHPKATEAVLFPPRRRSTMKAEKSKNNTNSQ